MLKLARNQRLFPGYILGSNNVSIGDVIGISQPILSTNKLKLDVNDTKYIDTLKSSFNHLTNKLNNNYSTPIYGVTTSVGECCEQRIDFDEMIKFQHNLINSHQTGLGDIYNNEEIRSILFVRLVQISRGYSGVSIELLNNIIDMINYDILPCIPKQGSLGASGDLIPLSYIAGAMLGKNTNIKYKDQVITSQEFYQTYGNELNMKPYTFKPKEGLAVINGTSVSTALLCLEINKIYKLIEISGIITGMMSNVMKGNPLHFDKRIYDVKPYNGSQEYVKTINLFHDHIIFNNHEFDGRCQQRYSVRCSPYIIGVLIDSLNDFIHNWLNIEINSSTDNPLIDPHNGDVLHGGNFYAGHNGFISDSLKQHVGNLIDMHDRQLMCLLDPIINNGLPMDLKYNSSTVGFKPFSLLSNSLTAEALHLVQPMTIFSRSSEGHNQDKVPMSTTSVRQLNTIINIAYKIVAINLIALSQAIDIRMDAMNINNIYTDNNIPLHPRCIKINSYIRDVLNIPKVTDIDYSFDSALNSIINDIENNNFNEFIANHLR